MYKKIYNYMFKIFKKSIKYLLCLSILLIIGLYIQHNTQSIFIINDITKNTIIINNNKIYGEVKTNIASVPKLPSLQRKERKNKNKEDNTKEQEIITTDDYFFGSSNAPITIVEYSSYNCPHCLSLHNNTMASIKVNYIDKNKVKYIKRIFIQKNSMLGVLLPYCAKPENRYNLVEDLYKNIDLWLDSRKQKEELKKIALKNGFTEEQFNSCIKNAKLANKIIKKQQEYARKFKIFSTPTLFINDKRITGSTSYNNIKKIIEEELARNN